ncbi:TerC family protein [bacterium]|nr:TerC family protein [bacterium]
MGGNELFSPLGVGFCVFIIGALAVDFGLLRKNGTHVVPVKEAARWTLVWIVLAIVFGVAIYRYSDFNATVTTEYFVGYLVEKSLSVDNIFVFTIIFAALKTPKKLQQLALMWGILLALLLRGIMILVGAALIERFEWIIWFFGGFLLLTGVQMLRGGGHSNESEPSAVKLARRFIRVNNDYNEERFWIFKSGRRVFTPIFLTIAVIGIIDFVFAVDSIPAIFGITLDPFIVFTSNAFAILGLRNLYFLLADAKDRFHYLSAGLAFVLMWIGVKMILPAINHDWKVPPLVSLVIVLTILTVSIVASLLRTKRVARKAPRPARARKR